MPQIKSRNNPSPFWFSIGLYALAAFIAFFPCLVLGQAYFDNDLLAQFGPWRVFLRAQLAMGHFPLWNPYNLGGMPFFADLQNMMLYPPNYLTLPFSVPYGLGVFYFLHFFGAAAGTHLWLRALGLTERACRVGALLFASSGFFWLEIIHPPVLAAYAWMPWVLYALEEWVRTRRPKAAFGTGLSFAFLFLCGSFQVSVGAFYGALAYGLYRLFARQPLPNRRETIGLILPLLWGALPLLAQFIPTLELARLSDRGSAPPDYLTFNSRLALEPFSIHQFLFPRILLPDGASLDHLVQQITGPGPFRWAGNWGYLGVWAPVLFLTAFQRKNRGLSLFLSAFLLVWLAVAMGPSTPLHRIFCVFLPGFSLLKVPYRFLFLYVLGAAALASIGFEGLFPEGKNLKTKVSPVLFTGALLLVPSLAGGIQTWRETLALSLGLGALVLKGRIRAKIGPPLFQAALVLPLLLSGWGDFPTGPSSNFNFIQNSKGLPQIARAVGPGRVLFGNQTFYPIRTGGKNYVANYPQNAAIVFSLKNFSGYNPLALSVKRDIARLPMETMVRLGDMEGILSMDPKLNIPGFKPQPFPPFTLYRWQKPLSLAYAPGKVEILPDPKERIARMERPGFDLAREAILDRDPPGDWPRPNRSDPARLDCSLETDGTDRQVFTVNLDRESLVVFTEVNYPGWKALVDGQPSPIFTADHLLRSLHLPAGRHRVEFRFEPLWARPLQAGLILWFLITLGWWFWESRPARKSQRA